MQSRMLTNASYHEENSAGLDTKIPRVTKPKQKPDLLSNCAPCGRHLCSILVLFRSPALLLWWPFCSAFSFFPIISKILLHVTCFWFSRETKSQVKHDCFSPLPIWCYLWMISGKCSFQLFTYFFFNIFLKLQMQYSIWHLSEIFFSAKDRIGFSLFQNRTLTL